MIKIKEQQSFNTLIRNKFFDSKIHRKFYIGEVKDIDYDGTKFEIKIPGAIKCRILGLHNYMKSDKSLPIFLPFFYFSGSTLIIPKYGDKVFITFEFKEPIGQGYWICNADTRKQILIQSESESEYKNFEVLKAEPIIYHDMICVYKMFSDSDYVVSNINTYKSYIVRAIKEKNMFNVQMVLYTMATIRVESSTFEPINEQISSYNTDKNPFDKYDYNKSIGNEGPPDGQLYRGRGFIQLTGKDNYKRIGDAIGIDLLNNPDLANEPYTAAKILIHFIKSREQQIKSALDKNDLLLARQQVNAAGIGIAEFEEAFKIGQECYLENKEQLSELSKSG